jgi:hypothetical protein
MGETEHVTEFVNGHVLDIYAVGTAGPREIGIALVQHHVGINEASGPVVPPVGLADV